MHTTIQPAEYYTRTVDDDALALAFKSDLHARCTYYRITSRFRECAWTPSGVCRNCGRPMPTLDQVAMRLEREQQAATPVLRRLAEVADEFERLATAYAAEAGSDNAVLHHETARASEQLRAARQFVIEGVYTQAHGALWIRAGMRILVSIKRGNR